MSKPLNIAYESFSMFFSPAYMQMRLYGNQGPKHYPSPKGVDTITMATLLYVLCTGCTKCVRMWNRRRVW